MNLNLKSLVFVGALTTGYGCHSNPQLQGPPQHNAFSTTYPPCPDNGKIRCADGFICRDAFGRLQCLRRGQTNK